MSDILKIEPIDNWLKKNNWSFYNHQIETVKLSENGFDVLLVAPTGGGKTLAGFLPSLKDLINNRPKKSKLHTLYISPLKALANDIDRNLKQPLEEMMSLAEKLEMDVPDIKVAVRSGDTSLKERARMVRKPPHILITTPESLGLLLSSKKFRDHFRKTRYIILDEIHDLANNKRGTHLSLSVERLAEIIDCLLYTSPSPRDRG